MPSSRNQRLVAGPQSGPKQHLRVGLTGGIGSGKSTVASFFSELGIPVISADQAARSVVMPGEEGLQRVVGMFGGAVLTAGGQLDRAALRRLVFDNPDARRQLEALLHPLIQMEMERESADVAGPYCIWEVPLLLEAHWEPLVDRVLVVDAEDQTRLARILARDELEPDEARAIIAAQIPRELRLKAADDVIRNEGDLGSLKTQVETLHRAYLNMAAARTDD